MMPRLENAMKPWLILLLMVSCFAGGEEIGNVNTAALNPLNRMEVDRRLRVTEVLGEIPVRLGKPNFCDVQSNRFSGWNYVVSNRDGSMESSFYGISFPSELVALDQPLNAGFKNSLTKDHYGRSSTYTAEYRDGVLVIEEQTELGGRMHHYRVEFSTKSTILNSTSIQQTVDTLVDDKIVHIKCIETPMA
jgi:hypothetical protein